MSFDDEEHRVTRILKDEPTQDSLPKSEEKGDEISSSVPSDTENKELESSIHAENSVGGSDDTFDNHEQISTPDNSDSSTVPNELNSEQDSSMTNDVMPEVSEQEESDRSVEPTEPNEAEQENQAEDDTVTKKEEHKQEEEEQEEIFTPPSEAYKKEKATHAEEEEPMGILDHLSELRRRLTRIVVIILIGFFGFYGVSELAYAYLALPLTSQLPEGSTLIYTSPQGAFFTYLKVSIMLSIIGTTPLTFYQVWAFIAPGLYKEEQNALIPLALCSAFFFIAGAAFCYFMVFPIAFKFFLGFTSETIIPMISVEEYLSFALKLIIAFGLVFEMPLFAYFMAKLRIITAEGMKKHRKYAILAIFIIAAILTPPDVFSQTLMALPMLILYEVSIYVAKVARGRRDKHDAEKNDTKENGDDSNETDDSINNFQ